MIDKPLCFGNVPERGRDVCDAIFFISTIETVVLAGIVIALASSHVHFDLLLSGFVALFLTFNLTGFSSCLLLARGRRLGRVLAWIVLPVFLFHPFKFYLLVRGLHSPEMNEFLNNGRKDEKDTPD